MRQLAIALTLAALPLSAASPQAKPVDWTKRVAATTDGGFVMGNPKAKVTLVEYGSLACPHCRAFAATATKPLKEGYIRSGKVRFEFRNFILNGYDLSASVIARCAGPSRFFPAAEAYFATQEQWIARIRATPRDRLAAVEALPDDKKLAAMADIGGFRPIAAANGIPAAAANRCLANPVNAQRLVAMTNAAGDKGVQGTPTFFLNGKRLEANTWPGVEAAIKTALQ
jgi:protein-disulfide isomerase